MIGTTATAFRFMVSLLTLDTTNPRPMSYQKAITELFSLRRFGIKPGLKNIQNLLAALGNPHESLNVIHVAGTNGKGSTAAFLQSLLASAHYRTGLYTSPHLIDFCERIRINQTQISRNHVVKLIQTIKNTCRRADLKNITFFEFATAMAFLYFKQKGADPVILETGLGGRLDSTNIIDPVCTIISNVSLEHQKYLGRTIAEITIEKAGIIKKNRPLVCGISQPDARMIIKSVCKKNSSPLYLMNKDFRARACSGDLFNYKSHKSEIREIKCPLKGSHQLENASLAIKAAEILQDKGYKITDQHITGGIARTFWPGRLETVSLQPRIILDGAHNPSAWKCLKTVIEKELLFNKLFLIIGVLEDKNISKLLKLLPPLAHKTLFCKPTVERAAGKEILKKYIVFSDNNRLFWYDNPDTALKAALTETTPEDLILVTGSLFTVGEIRQQFINKNTFASGRIPL